MNHPATAALRDLNAYRERQREPARKVSALRWPERAKEAGTAAKLARQFHYFVVRVLTGGCYSW